MNKIFRYSIKAIIIKDNKLLVESCDYGRGRFCKLPGGGHQWGETMKEAAAILNELKCPFVINQNRYSIFDRTVEKNGILEAANEIGKTTEDGLTTVVSKNALEAYLKKNGGKYVECNNGNIYDNRIEPIEF